MSINDLHERALSLTAGELALLERKLMLTPRESQIVALIFQGKHPKEIAAEFGTSTQTVRRQLHDLYARLGVDGQNPLLLRMFHILRSTARRHATPLDVNHIA
jgi:DNA-binding CsgD family transcriptional regulator